MIPTHGRPFQPWIEVDIELPEDAWRGIREIMDLTGRTCEEVLHDAMAAWLAKLQTERAGR